MICHLQAEGPRERLVPLDVSPEAHAPGTPMPETEKVGCPGSSREGIALPPPFGPAWAAADGWCLSTEVRRSCRSPPSSLLQTRPGQRHQPSRGPLGQSGWLMALTVAEPSAFSLAVLVPCPFHLCHSGLHTVSWEVEMCQLGW